MRIIQMGILKIKFCVIMIENQLRCLHLHLDLVTLNIMYLNLIHWLVLQSNTVLRYFSTYFVFLVFLYKVWFFFGCLQNLFNFYWKKHYKFFVMGFNFIFSFWLTLFLFLRIWWWKYISQFLAMFVVVEAFSEMMMGFWIFFFFL